MIMRHLQLIEKLLRLIRSEDKWKERVGLVLLSQKRNLLLNDRCARAVVCVLKALYWIDKEDISLRKWHSL